MVWKLKEEVKDQLDPYQNKRGTNDAILTMLHHVVKHLEDPNAQARFFFLDLLSIPCSHTLCSPNLTSWPSIQTVSNSSIHFLLNTFK